jgi:hypothetical protein
LRSSVGNFTKRNWDDPTLSYLQRVQLIPDPSQRVLMSHLYTYGQQDFNKNIEVVEQDLTGDLDVILEKMMK